MKAPVAVDASAGVLRRVVVQTLVDVDSAVGPGVAATLANRPRGSFLTKTLVLARVGVAEAPVVASLAAQLRRALAVVVVAKVDALGAEQTGAGGAGVVVVLAV